MPHVASAWRVLGELGSSCTTPSRRAIEATAAENEEERDSAEQQKSPQQAAAGGTEQGGPYFLLQLIQGGERKHLFEVLVRAQ